MILTQKDIDRALGDAEALIHCPIVTLGERAARVLAKAYRAELKANEGEVAYGLLLERQYAELNEYVNHDAPDERQAMFKRHEAERKGQ
jgi:hypothetical protein